ncbi:MAG: methyltransferase family protein [Notoacmeibacter sp.]
MANLQWATLGVVALYLILFFAMTAIAARVAGQSVWLFGSASGTEKLAAIGFRASFAVSIIGSVLLALFPQLQAFDPLSNDSASWLMFLGHLIAVAGAMLAFAAQVSMGASWRVGVHDDSVGALVSGGLYDFSRNPTFVGQGLLLVGMALAVPSIFTLLGALLFMVSAHTQVKSEEAALGRAYGNAYGQYLKRVPRWFGLGFVK